MAYILNIETSGNLCSVALGNNGELIAFKESNIPNSHAKHCALFIEDVLMEANIKADELHAIAVSEGPGSYTGLRIGVSIAKGMCFAMGIPLIALSTLQLMAAEAASLEQNKNALYAPLIDARRMEVYTAVYDYANKMVAPVSPQIVNEQFHKNLLQNNIVYYSGSGMPKSRSLITHENARFSNLSGNSARNMIKLSQVYYNTKSFVDVAYFEPVYLKLFGEIL
jgi:tRNA threonylcarbamoyladenosine biosynthesis protein TsaB